MPMHPAGSVKKNGQEIDIRVDDDGRWHADVGNDRLAALTRDELVKLIDKATKKINKSVRVPFTSISVRVNYNSTQVTTTAKSGVATGLHSGNNNVIGRWGKDNASFQMSSWDSRDLGLYRPVTQAEYEEYKALLQASADARHAVDEWEKARKIDLHAEVVAALEKAISTEE
jgi:hypothetical protein